MRRISGRQLSLTPLVALALGAALAAALALLVEDRARTEPSPGLVVGVFATFLTSTSIVAAFSVEGKSRWPTPWETLQRAGVLDWFLVALASVAIALVAVAIDSAFLSAFGLILALVGLALGARGLWGLFALSSDRGRHELVVDLLADSIRRAEPVAIPESLDLGDIDTEDHVPAWFSSVETAEAPSGRGVSIGLVPGTLRLYADRGDADAIVRLVDEVHAAAIRALADRDWGGPDLRLARVDRLLGVLRGMFGELAERVAAGRLDGPVALGGLARVGEAVIDVGGRARISPAAVGQGETEILAARHLAAFCRLAGAAATRAELATTCINLQQAARWAVDPDPPGMRLPAEHPWRAGLRSAEGALVWQWSAAESPTGPYGVGLYALCEILTGRKFFGSYWDGDDVFTEIERRLVEPSGGPVATAGREALERAGGLPRAALELAATRLRALERRGSAVPPGLAAPEAARQLACELFLAGGGYKPADRDPVADLAWLLTDRSRGSLWTTVHDQLARLREPRVRPPLHPLHSQPAACALAVALRLAPPLRAAGADDLTPLCEFSQALPGPLLSDAGALARKLIGAADAELDEPGVALVAAAEAMRKLVPGARSGPADQDGPGIAPEPAAGRATPLDGPAEFAAALNRIATARSPVEVDLIQCDLRWLDRWAELRSELDAELLAAALRGHASVRRILRFDLDAEARRGETLLHYRWTDALAAAAGCFDGGRGGRSRYRVRQLILPFGEPGTSPPADCAVVRSAEQDGSGAGATERFEAIWGLLDRDADAAGGLGLVEQAGRGAPTGSP